MFTAQEIANELERTIPVMQEAAEDSMHEMLDVAARCWEEAAPHGGTGKLGRDVRQTVRRNATGVSGTLQPKTPEARLIAGYVDRGTGLWVEHHSAITPKAARGPKARLRFADGTFRRSSKGTRPTNFIQKAKDAADAEVADIAAAGARKASEKLFR